MSDDEVAAKAKDIRTIVKGFFYKTPIFADFVLSQEHKSALLSLFILKGVLKASWYLKNNEASPQSSDAIINSITETYKNFSIFYLSVELSHQEINNFKKNLIRVIRLLILNNVIREEKSFKKNRTLEEWSLSLKNTKPNLFEFLGISNKPLKLLKINENYYCVGGFFTLIKKIFVENLKSDIFFKLKDHSYIENMASSPIYINVDDLDDAVNFFNQNRISEDAIHKNMSDGANNIESINRELGKLNKIIANETYIKIKEIMNSEYAALIQECESLIQINGSEGTEGGLKTCFAKLKKKILKEFILKVKSYCEDLEFVLSNDKAEFIFLKEIHRHFIEYFCNAHYSLKFNSLEELIASKNKFSEFSTEFITQEEEEGGLGGLNRIEVKKKINSENIGLLAYLYILNEEEMRHILKKKKKSIIKKINLNCSDKEDALQLENIGGSEKHLSKNLNALVTNILFKINTNYYKDEKLIGLKKTKINLIIEKRAIFSKISKQSSIYNIILLKKFLDQTRLFKQNELRNVEVYFMFYFDFRGRFYHDSPVSPTSSKLSRTLFNYGEVTISEIKTTEISIYIEKFTPALKTIKDMFEIKHTGGAIFEIIFWILISVGKLRLDKSKTKTSTGEILESGISLLTNENKRIALDLGDCIELSNYRKILESLKFEKTLRRCLVKDATASFFQNLIRILGAKNEETKKLANLIDNDHWYDWYSNILEKWKTDTKGRRRTEENILRYFTRKTTKKIIMTLPYSATFPTSFEYFKESVFELFQIDISADNDLFDSFTDFFSFLKKNLEEDGPFKENPNKIIDHFDTILKKGDTVTVLSKNDDLADLTYYKTITKHFDFIIKWNNEKVRKIKNYSVLDLKQIDKKKIRTSVKANLVHFADALLLRDINKEIFKENGFYYLTVHDCFLVDFTNISNFILVANKKANLNVFKEEIWENEKNFSSIYIFI